MRIVSDPVVMGQPGEGVNLLVKRDGSEVVTRTGWQHLAAAVTELPFGMGPEAETAIGANDAEGFPLVIHAGLGRHQVPFLSR